LSNPKTSAIEWTFKPIFCNCLNNASFSSSLALISVFAFCLITLIFASAFQISLLFFKPYFSFIPTSSSILALSKGLFGLE